MPTEAQHITAANRTHDTIAHLLSEKVRTSPWIATTAFYKALQIVEAAFCNNADQSHSSCHDEREDTLKRTPRYRKLYSHYSVLKRVSLIARYIDGAPDFDAYMSPDDVVDKLLKHHLKQVEKAALKILSAPNELTTIDAAF